MRETQQMGVFQQPVRAPCSTSLKHASMISSARSISSRVIVRAGVSVRMFPIVCVEREDERMDKSQILEKLAAVVIDGTEDEAKALAQAVVANHIDLLEAIEMGLSKGMTIIGGK